MAPPLSANAARALEQVKMGLLILCGASYFSDDEWIKIDGLIHKGQYKFTNGPPNIIDSAASEELMSFDEQINLPVQDNQSFDKLKENLAAKEDPVVVTEKTFDYPTESDRVSSTGPTETPNGTSVEASSDDEPATKAVDSSVYDLSHWEPPAESVTVEQPKPIKPTKILQRETIDTPDAGGRASYAAEQFAEIKAFNASLTKAGQKSRPKYGKESSGQPSVQASAACHTNSDYDTPTGIRTWVSEVEEENVSRPRSSTSPKKGTGLAKAVVAPSPKPAPPYCAPGKRQLTLQIGSTYVAQSSQVKTSSIRLAIDPGDQIQVLAYISGITYKGLNLRIKAIGHFAETVLKKQPEAAQKEKIRASSNANPLDDFERVNAAEWDEAPVIKGKSHATTATGPTTAKPPGGLGASRCAAPAGENESVISGSESIGYTSGMSREEVEKMVDEKILAARRPVSSGPAMTKKLSRNETLIEPPRKTATCWYWATPNRECRYAAHECRHLHEHGYGFELSKGKPTWGSIADCVPTPTANHTDSQVASPSAPASPATKGSENFTTDVASKKTCWFWANQNHCNNTSCRFQHAQSPYGVATRPGAWYKTSKTANPKSRDRVSASLSNSIDEFGRSTSATINGKDEDESNPDLPAATPAPHIGRRDEEESRGWGESAQKEEAAARLTTTVTLDKVKSERAPTLLKSGWGESANKPLHIQEMEEKAIIEAVGW
ncbi:hypothetical protein BUE80_DR011165 [Diplocarpon rosae]|nr:hypothetical protein BUE80_DR011165 [Diplocarpon rosae]